MNNPLVRQAVAYGLNGAAVAKAFYGGVGTPATQFLPPSLAGFAKKGVPAYKYDPAKSIALLKQAGLTPPVKIDFWWPTSISRPYMPDPQRNFEAFAASLNKAGFQVEAHSAPWRPDYRAGVQAGKAQLFLFGWNPDFIDPANYLNVHFGSKTAQFGFDNQALFTLLAKADAASNADARAALYQQASVQVMKLLPVIPYVWAAGAIVFDSSVKGFVPSPVGTVNEPMATPLVRLGRESRARSRRTTRCFDSSSVGCCFSYRSCSGSRSSSSSGSGRCRDHPPSRSWASTPRRRPSHRSVISTGSTSPIYVQYWALPEDARQRQPRHQHREHAHGHLRARAPFPGDDRAGSRGDDLRDRRRHAAGLPLGEEVPVRRSTTRASRHR